MSERTTPNTRSHPHNMGKTVSAPARTGQSLRKKVGVVAVFCMSESSHYGRLHPIIHDLASRGVTVHVFTDHVFASRVEQAGGVFHDLFARYPLQQADNTSLPVSSRNVTFAGTYAEPISREVARLAPSLVIHGTFAVIGRVVATILGLPRVNVCAGHNVQPEQFLNMLKNELKVSTSPQCLRAVQVLRESYGLTDASPFSFISSLSPDLNIYCEPPQFLDAQERKTFEPVVFYGSLPCPDGTGSESSSIPSLFGSDMVRRLKVYVSFGTISWRNFTNTALQAARCLASTFADIGDLQAVLTLGGREIDAKDLASLRRPNVSVESWVDQRRILQEADIFITHHGMNSTHEAIFHQVPMISYPFFWDQPGMARKCQQLGMAIPLAAAPQASLGQADVKVALQKLSHERESMQKALARARGWELAVMETRPVVIQRILDLMGQGGQARGQEHG
jgi:MGT family glycosyltransferase